MKKLTLVLLAFWFNATMAFAGDVVALSWEQVVDVGLKQNLELKILKQDIKNQKFNVYKSISDFLPTVNYSFQAVNNVELPVLVFMGNRFRIGTKYNFTHALQLQYPLFLGGARLANFSIQRHARKSLLQMLKGKEQEVAFKAIEAYYQVMLSNDLLRVNQKAWAAAKANFEQVEKFYQAGTASQLDFLRAKARLSQTIPALTSAKNKLQMSKENLKFILNLAAEDSIVILDSLVVKHFWPALKKKSLAELQTIALQSRPDLKSLEHQKTMSSRQKWIAGSRFVPQVVLTANVQHQAFLEKANVTAKDYTRSKAAGVVIQWPLFEGAKRVFELQQSFIQSKKMELQQEQLRKAILLEVKNSYHQFQEAEQNLVSLEAAFQEAQETLRLADLMYKEGVSTQVEVLNAQTAFTNAELSYRKGIFDYNISQLRLLKAIGQLQVLWQSSESRN